MLVIDPHIMFGSADNKIQFLFTTTNILISYKSLIRIGKVSGFEVFEGTGQPSISDSTEF